MGMNPGKGFLPFCNFSLGLNRIVDQATGAEFVIFNDGWYFQLLGNIQNTGVIPFEEVYWVFVTKSPLKVSAPEILHIVLQFEFWEKELIIYSN